MNLEPSQDPVKTRTVIPRQGHVLSRKDVSANALKVLYRLQKAGYEAYLVGGCVRDLLLQRKPKDFDVATDATPEQIKDLFRNCRLIGRRFRLAHIHFGREIIEVATFRGSGTGSEHEGSMRSSENGMLVRDNAYGTLESDAWRRDFTVNSLYYSIRDFSVIDFVDGLSDLQNGILRPIGDAGLRFREDPVRMLRAVRFAAKLAFHIESKSYQTIIKIGDCLQGVPPARLFDEVLKLFISGCAAKTFAIMRETQLLNYLFPQTAVAIDQNEDLSFLSFVERALHNTDIRISEGKPVTPAFLMAALLWPAVRSRWQVLMDEGEKNTLALQQAIQESIDEQVQQVSIPRRISVPMRDIWSFQIRLQRCNGKRPIRMLAHPRFRAAYDFLVLRADAGEDQSTQTLADWWTQFQIAGSKERQNMIKSNHRPEKKKRRARRTKIDGS